MGTSHLVTAQGTTSPTAPILTFLLADVRGFTAYTHEYGDEAGAQLSQRFLSICRETVSAHDGRLFGSAGDQALVAFVSARQALRAAVALQQRLATEQEEDPRLPLLAGIGLDAGEAVQVDEDYRGEAVNLAARLCSIAGAGEILASEGVTYLARKTEGLAYVDRGEVAFKGISHPVRVIQIGREGTLPAELPPLQPLNDHPTNLPGEATLFIGRVKEIAEISSLIQQPNVRLVTLTGTGGTGKTRLALQVGAALLHSFRDGVFVVSLASLAEPALVPSTIADVLGVGEAPDRSQLDEVTNHLKEKHLLLILDNFEHLTGAADAVAHLLDTCRELHILITSRMPLHLTREHEYPVAPLSIPDSKRRFDIQDLSRYEAVALFVDRARAIKPSFQLTPENSSAVAEICSRLDGLPLAIELATSRLRLFPPQALLERLSKRLQLLTGGAKDRPTRQQTLRGAIDWSYSLLSDEEQTLFARLSVFSGGCSFDAAEMVCTPEGDLDLLEGITSLIEKSLLRQEGEDEPRFRMLETIREYAAEKLAAADEQEAVSSRHVAYFLHLAEEADPELVGADQLMWLTWLEREHDNFRAALRWTEEPGRVEQGLQLAAALCRFWMTRGPLDEGRGWLQRLLELARDPDVTDGVRARAEYAAGALAYRQTDHREAIAHWQQAEEIFRKLSDTVGTAMVLNGMGIVSVEQARYERAREQLEESIRLYREANDSLHLGYPLNNLANVERYQGHYRRAMQLYEESRAAFRLAGARHSEATALDNLSQIANELGEYDRAESLGRESAALSEELGNQHGKADVLANLGGVALNRGDIMTAADLFEEALSLYRSIGSEGNYIFPLHNLSTIALIRGDRVEARMRAEAALTLARGHESPRGMAYALMSLGDIAVEDGELARAKELFEESRQLNREIGYSLGVAESTERLARVSVRQNRLQEATQLYAEAAAIRKRIETPVPPIERPQHDRDLDVLRAGLDTTVFETAWSAGWELEEPIGS